MMAKDLIKKLMELPTDALDSDVFAGEEEDDEVVDVFVGEDGEVTLYTARQRAEDDDRNMAILQEQDTYWKQKELEWAFEDRRILA